MTMTATPTKAYKTWRARLAGPTIGHGFVIQLARGIYPASRGAMMQGRHSSLTETECRELIDQLHARVKVDGGIRAEPQNEERGRHWLNEYARRMGLPMDRRYLDIVEFRLVGFHRYWEDHTRYGYRIDAAPIWHASWADGTWIEYAPTAWQGSLSSKLPPLWWQVGGTL
mgnify:CR=1 FL=1